MHVDICCKTDRFNLSVVGDDFINDCCFGEDFSIWLIDALANVGIQADVICMEDFGWANHVVYQGVSYSMMVAGASDGAPLRPNFGEWHVMLERSRTPLEKLLGKNKTSPQDPVCAKLATVLRSAGFQQVAIER